MSTILKQWSAEKINLSLMLNKGDLFRRDIRTPALLITLIYFLLLIPWPHTQFIRLLCSKDSSRLVRKIVRSKWTPILDKYQVKLPLECPLHPFRDLYSPRQDAKKRDRPTQWTCRLCGKSFYQEKFLDQHFEARHKSTINEAEDAVCLAEFCDIMRCEVFQSEESLKIGDHHVVTEIEVWGNSFGQNSALAKVNAAYMSLMPLRSSSRTAKVQNRQLCQDKIGQNSIKDNVDTMESNDKSKITNDSAMKKSSSEPSPGGSTGTSPAIPINTSKESKAPKQQAAKQASKQTTETRNESESAMAPEVAPENGNQTANMQKVKANCKAEELSRLKSKCEILVHSCIGSLMLKMSDLNFKEMEEEMNKAVCWYLSCDRYWEDGPLEPRAFPWGLILILIFVLSIGICFCYYIIWILFDSEESTINANHHTYMQRYYPYQADAMPAHGMSGTPTHYYYHQQPGAQHDLYPEPPQYDYRHSPRRHYVNDPRPQQGTPTSTATDRQTPLHQPHLHHPTSHAYQPAISDRRDYTSSRPSGASMGTGHSTSAALAGSAVAAVATGAAALAAVAGVSAMRECDTSTPVGSGVKHYNTHPRPLDGHHRHGPGASQQSLRGSTSSHEIIQNEIGHNEHYIYVTYPPDLKKRFFDKYE